MSIDLLTVGLGLLASALLAAGFVAGAAVAARLLGWRWADLSASTSWAQPDQLALRRRQRELDALREAEASAWVRRQSLGLHPSRFVGPPGLSLYDWGDEHRDGSPVS